MKTAMQELSDFIYNNDIKNPSESAALALKFIEVFEKERNQIEGAYNNAKNYPDENCDGNKYYFMNYISND